MATTYYTDIQKLYVAYFNRPADVAGLAYWETVVEANKGNTAAVSAAFAASAEYKAAYAGQTNEQIVNTVYLNLFSHAADAPGQAYWADLLTRNKITIDGVVTQIAGGALTTDLTAYNNKVTAAGAFTTALDLPAEAAGYANPLAIPSAKAFIAGITTDASLQAALAPATLNASVAAVVAAGTPFTLNNALSTLQAATDAKAAFLDAADGKADGVTTTTDISIAADVTAKTTAVDALVAGYVAGSTAVKAALLSDKVAANAKVLADAQAVVATDNANIAKVAGLTAAVNAEAATAAGVKAAAAVLLTANADLASKIASYNVLNGSGTTTKVVTLAADGTATIASTTAGVTTTSTLIKLDSTNHLVLNSSTITETNNPGVTALLASTISHETADANVTAAANAEAATLAQLNYLDQTATEVTDLANIAAGMHNVTVTAGVQPTLADISTETSILAAKQVAANQAVVASAAANEGGAGVASPATLSAQTTANNNVTAFANLVTTYNTDTVVNPLSAKLTADAAIVTADSTIISNLTKAVAALATSSATATQLAAVNSSIDAANKAFVDHSLSTPVTAAGSLIASAGSDIFIAGTANSSIALFGLQGSDSLYIGTKYTLNAGDFTKAGTGNDSVLEAFLVQNGADVQVVLETKAFSSNSTDPEIVITLTGTTVDHVHLANGIITVA